MAELVAGAVVGELLKSLIDAVRRFKHSHESVLQLEGRLQRLTPLVELLGFIRTESRHPAREWLRDLQKELRKAHSLVANSGGSVKRMLESGNLKKINERISELLADSIPIQLVELRRQVEEVFKYTPSHLRGKELKRLTNEFDLATHNTVDDGSSSSTAAITNSRWSRACDIPDPPQVTFGGTAVADEQIENILHGEYRKWIVMWGMGGVGKTFTTNHVFHNTRIKQHFTGGTYWVTVSKDNPPPHHLLKQLCMKIGSNSDFPGDLQAARSRVRTLLDREKVLLVLDDVWHRSILEYLDVLCEERKGVVLVTTRDREILKCELRDGEHLKSIVDCARIVEIPRLSTDDSWQLFSWHAFDVYKRSVPADLDIVARDVAQECKGLPLALKVIGSAMGRIHLFSFNTALGQSYKGEWEKALQQLRNLSHFGDTYESLYNKLQWSVDNLVDQDDRLKDCFFYFAAYPEDYPVPVKELVSIWAAEGLCNEEQGKTLLACLIAKSMIELSDDGQMCKIHDVMRDLVIRNLELEAGQAIPVSQRTCLYKPGLALNVFPKEWATRGVQLSAERLSLQNNTGSLRQLPDLFNAPNLRVLMLRPFGYSNLRYISPGFFRNLLDLRVLVLSSTGIAKVPGSVLQSLESLVLLDLTDCRQLVKVSDKLDSLQNLETVLLEGCNILCRLPRMKSLKKLHTLSVPLPNWYNLYSNGYCWQKGYRFALKVSRSPLVESVWSAPPLCLTLGLGRYGLGHVRQLYTLHRLNIAGGARDRCGARGRMRCLPDLSSLSALSELKLGYCPQIPAGLMGLRDLKVLHIEDTEAATLPPLYELPLLEELSIMEMRNCRLPESFGRDGAFPSLRKLVLHKVGKLFTFHSGTMPKIEILLVGCCRDINVSFSRLSTLKCLYLVIRVFGGSDLEAVFTEPDCFPNLERLAFWRDTALGMVPQWGALPQHILERQSLGKLKIELLRDLPSV